MQFSLTEKERRMLDVCRSSISLPSGRHRRQQRKWWKVRENAREHVTDTARRAHKGPGGIMHGGCSVNFGTQNSVSGLLRCHPAPTSARSDKSECIYIHKGVEIATRRKSEKGRVGSRRAEKSGPVLDETQFSNEVFTTLLFRASISLLAHGAWPRDSLFINAIGKTPPWNLHPGAIRADASPTVYGPSPLDISSSNVTPRDSTPIVAESQARAWRVC